MTETTFTKLREKVAKDAGLPSTAAAEFRGETIERIAEEAVEYARERRGPAAVREVLANFEAADRNEPSAVRDRVGRDLGIAPELRDQLTGRTEAEVAESALRMHRKAGDVEAYERAEKKISTLAGSDWLRSQQSVQRGELGDLTNINDRLRAAGGRTDEN